VACVIHEYCTACAECLPACPVQAIVEAHPAFRINPHVCIECLGYADAPQCAKVCPVGAVDD
jgi:ferredoxin